jgi:hypothetical protein
MGLKRIFIAYETPRALEIAAWFDKTFGVCQNWGGMRVEPVELKSNYQWAMGLHQPIGFERPSPCIWCTEKAYLLYSLRWL